MTGWTASGETQRPFTAAASLSHGLSTSDTPRHPRGSAQRRAHDRPASAAAHPHLHLPYHRPGGSHAPVEAGGPEGDDGGEGAQPRAPHPYRPPAPLPLPARNAELELEVAILRRNLGRTRGSLQTADAALSEQQATLQATAARLAEAQGSMAALHGRLQLSRQVASASLAQSDGARREAHEVEGRGRTAKALLDQLAGSLRAVLGARAPAGSLGGAGRGTAATVASLHAAAETSAEDVLALERAVRQAIEGARAENCRLSARVHELSAALTRAGGAAGPRRPHSAAAVRVEAGAGAREEAAAAARREERAAAQAAQLRLALAAAHAELEAHRQGAARGGGAHRPARAGGGWELVLLEPPLLPPPAAMPACLVGHVRGVPYRLGRLRSGAELLAALDECADGESLRASHAPTRVPTPGRAEARPARASSAQPRRPPLAPPRPTSSASVLRHAEQIRAATPALQAQRPTTAPSAGLGDAGRGALGQAAEGLAEGEARARQRSAEALRRQRELLSGQLAHLWS